LKNAAVVFVMTLAFCGSRIVTRRLTQGRTTIIIAHRLTSVVAAADRIQEKDAAGS
jgi:ABC-type transport system involved in Fe-S cluster assembly fused permease/ATPase subunit